MIECNKIPKLSGLDSDYTRMCPLACFDAWIQLVTTERRGDGGWENFSEDLPLNKEANSIIAKMIKSIQGSEGMRSSNAGVIDR